jgi:succinoglycan biosynthesis protein ExoV
MNLKYFKAETHGNFGDDLNPYIFKKMFPKHFEQGVYDDIDFCGIGTILGTAMISEKKTVVFGTGIRDIARKYNKENWDVFFLRGPISSNVLGYNGEKYITDAAYLLPLVNQSVLESVPKKHKVSVIPHFEHLLALDWKKLQRSGDFNLIDIREPVETVIKQICESEKVIASAMHGAIMADICRVPWLRMRMSVQPSETFLVSDMKWNDWLLSLNMNDGNAINVENYQSKDRYLFYYYLSRKIKRGIQYGNFQLSEDKTFELTLNKLSEQIDQFKTTYPL